MGTNRVVAIRILVAGAAVVAGPGAGLSAALLSLTLLAPAGALADGVHSCGDLVTAEMRPPDDARNLTIDSAVVVAGAAAVPEHCLVQGHLDTEINFVMKLPTAWNGKVLMRGNFAFAGYIPYLDDLLAMKYAVVGTDTGHSRGDTGGAEALLNRPDRIANFQYRAVHLVALTARQVAKTYYHSTPRHSYFTGCSGGGRQAMLEVQKYPDDFDGVIAGAPGLPNGGFRLWNMRALFPGGPATDVLPSPKVALLSQLVLEKCDGLDGMVDGIVDDPRACNFSPKDDLPRCVNDVDGPDCFTRAQVAALAKIHHGPQSQRRSLGPPFFFSGVEGYSYGDVYGIGVDLLDFSETSSGYPGVPALFPDYWDVGIPSQDYWLEAEFLRNIAFGDPSYLLQSFNFDRPSDLATYLGALQPQLPTSPDLSAFARRGGKLIEWQGWGDSVNTPMATVQFYEAGAKAVGGVDRAKSFDRLFMVPGTAHCGDGPGPWSFDPLPALEQWVEAGKVPNALTGTNPDSGLSRPICAYPKVARLKDPSLDPGLASSFACVDVEESDGR
jgi:hypothetical protein